ncbi:YHYH protein [Humisphaera borealis]|uniref:YHYH protein n=1 Tax=Humisphaera borealis TaxID=2807512 RepID=A0A7M2X0Q7_9BACT|nr:YHYH protein [Humisphaera borealis]QOV91234.1 YHYH protein [Humisphaera borealis]
MSLFRKSFALVALLGTGSVALAHPGHPNDPPTSRPSGSADRTWTVSGVARETGSFVMARDGFVQVRRSDDSLVTMRISALTDDDQVWIRQRIGDINAAASKARPTAGETMIDRVTELPAENARSEAFGDAIALARMAAESALPAAQMLMEQLAARGVATGGFEVAAPAELRPEIAKAFDAYVNLKAVKTRWDDRYFYVESNGIPAHQMMVGITAWQQQVPMPQKYTGENAWRIPLHPVPAKEPKSAKGNFLRGAIALAANGIPIFNPLNNRGDDALLFGELDDFGGHCGRADDYHYHIAPVHLQKTVGKGLPIAYALDGYAIYGYEEPDGSPVKPLDAMNGHKDENGSYHYHATKKYPYLNGGFHGEVVERDGQVDPQPRADSVRPALPPMRGAKITDFVQTKPGSYRLTYDVSGKKGTVSYTLADDGSAKFEFVDTAGNTTTETYTPRRRGPGGGGGGPGSGGGPGGGGGDRRPPPGAGDAPQGGNPPGGQGGNRPPRDGQRPPPRDGQRPPEGGDQRPPRDDPPRDNPPRDNSRPPEKAAAAIPPSAGPKLPALTLSSASVNAAGQISIDCTCDGAAVSPAIAWKDVPAGTKSFAVSLWHTAPDQEKSYWVVYNIPPKTTGLAQKSAGVGVVGLNDRRRNEYDPMCSKGPGVKTYHITVFALSAEPKLAADKANRAGLLEAIKDIKLAEATLDYQYERKAAK